MKAKLISLTQTEESSLSTHRAYRRLPFPCSRTGTSRWVVRSGQWNCLDGPSTQTWLVRLALLLLFSPLSWIVWEGIFSCVDGPLFSNLLNIRHDVVMHACLKGFRLGLAFQSPNTFPSSPCPPNTFPSSPCPLGIWCIFRPLFACLPLAIPAICHSVTPRGVFFSGPLHTLRLIHFSLKSLQDDFLQMRVALVGFAFTALGIFCYWVLSIHLVCNCFFQISFSFPHQLN